MFAMKRLLGGCVFVSTLVTTTALAQVARAPVGIEREPVAAVAPLVTAAASAKRVRFVSPGTVVQLRLEIYNEAGQKLFDTELHGGNVLDWHLQDGAGQRLPAGSYACVLTIKSLSGRLSQRVGVVTVNDDKAAVETASTALSLAQQQTIGPVEANAAFTIVQESEAEAITAVTHDGTEGQLARTRGALSFRLGDVFSGKDKEQMRLTEEGNLGLGTSEPKAKLDVAGTIRAERVMIARPKSGSAAGDTSLAAETAEIDQPLVAGTGTQNNIAKWTDNAGTLGNSSMFDTSGRVGLGTTTPGAKFHVVGSQGSVGAGSFQLDTPTLFSNWTGAYPALEMVNTNLTNNNISLFQFADAPSGAAHAGIGAVNTSHANKYGDLFFFSKQSDGYQMRMGIFGGNVGVGTTQPTHKLHLVDQGHTGLRVETGTPGGTLASFGGHGDFEIDAPGVVGGRFAVKEGGRVGIGTNTPLAALDLQGGADGNGFNNPSAMAFQWHGGGFRHWIRTRHNSVLGSGNAIDFFVNDSTTAQGSSGPGLGSGSAFVMTLDSGRVGIGTFEPTEKLSVEGRIQSTFGGFKFPDGSVQTTAITNAAYYTTVNDMFLPLSTTHPNETVVLHLNLPAGTYLITADVRFRNSANYFNADNSRLIMCRFSGEGEQQGDGGYRHMSTIGGPSRLEMSFHTVATISSGGVDVLCRAFSWEGDLAAESRRLTAVKIDGTLGVQ